MTKTLCIALIAISVIVTVGVMMQVFRMLICEQAMGRVQYSVHRTPLRNYNPVHQRIAMCTMVRNEVPYLPEWIEFHRIQGVDVFWIFDDRSTDNIQGLEILYARKLPTQVVVKVIKSPGGQAAVWAACQKMASKDKIDWVGVVDVDEFWHSPTHPSIRDVLSQLNTSVASVSIEQFRYGTNGQLHRFKYSIDNKGHLSNPEGIQSVSFFYRTETHGINLSHLPPAHHEPYTPWPI